MTDIAFHFNVPDRVSYACRLLRKAVRAGAKVVVTGPQDILAALDAGLWSFSTVDFLPHCYVQSAKTLLAASPVVLGEAIDDAPHHQILLNLGPQVPTGFVRFERVIELVLRTEDDRQRARVRWKQYVAQGHTISRHDMALKVAA